MATTAEDITKLVDASYSERARTGADSSFSRSVASRVGYTDEQLASLPPGSNLGLSCGTPLTAAGLQPGESVLDLGSGGGLDVFLAADQVGPGGQVVGLDGSKDMIDLARRNAKIRGLKVPNVAFAYAALTENLPVESASVDCVLSNCVLNLLPPAGKSSILKEVFRVLKPNGRVSIADVVATGELPDNIRNDTALYVNCVSGAMSPTEYENFLKAAGFTEISLVNTGKDLSACHPQSGSTCQPKPSSQTQTAGCCEAPPSSLSVNLEEFVASYQITARKPHDPTIVISSTILKEWQSAFPNVQSIPATLTAEEVAALIRDPTKNEKDFTVIDVRRNDHAGGHVRGSHQCPAQTFYDDAAGVFEKFKGSEKVVFYCQSSNGRGPRCAGWYQDYLNAVEHSDSKAYVMTGGIKGWMSKYEGQDDLVDYD